MRGVALLSMVALGAFLCIVLCVLRFGLQRIEAGPVLGRSREIRPSISVYAGGYALTSIHGVYVQYIDTWQIEAQAFG